MLDADGVVFLAHLLTEPGDGDNQHDPLPVGLCQHRLREQHTRRGSRGDVADGRQQADDHLAAVAGDLQELNALGRQPAAVVGEGVIAGDGCNDLVANHAEHVEFGKRSAC